MRSFLNGLLTTAFKLTGGTPGSGKVLTSDADGNGTWQNPSAPSTLDDLSDVGITSVADAQILTYDSLSSEWVNADPSVLGTGDVVGPASATDNAIVRYDATTGKLIQDSVVTISDTGSATGFTRVGASDAFTLSGAQALSRSGTVVQHGVHSTYTGHSFLAGGVEVAAIDSSGNMTTANGTVALTSDINYATNIYGSSHLATFKAALADKENNPVDIVVIGDSKAEGTGAAIGTRWVDKFLQSFRYRNQPSSIRGGYGYVPGTYVSGDMTDAFSLTGSATATTTAGSDTLGLGKRCIVMTTSAGTATITVGPGTDFGSISGFDICYTQNSSQGAFTVAVDGGSAVAVNANNATEVVGKRYSITGLDINAQHTIVVSRTSGTVTLEGIMLYDGDESAGIRLWDASHHGIQVASYSTTDKWWKALTTIQPALIYYQIGRNDFSSGTSVASLVSAIEAHISHIRSLITVEPSIIIGMDWHDNLTSPTDTYDNWRKGIYDMVAVDGNLALFDIYKTFGTITGSGTNGAGLSDTDYIHPSVKGHAAIANDITAYLEATVASDPSRNSTQWWNYTPTFSASGSMTITSTSIDGARYRVRDKTVEVEATFSMTLGGTMSNEINMTLPLPISSFFTAITPGSVLVNISALEGGTAYILSSDASTAHIRRYNNSNFTSGSRTIYVNFRYETP